MFDKTSTPSVQRTHQSGTYVQLQVNDEPTVESIELLSLPGGESEGPSLKPGPDWTGPDQRSILREGY